MQYPDIRNVFCIWYIVSANSNLLAVASSTYRGDYVALRPSNVLDGLYGNDCIWNNVYSSIREANPWLEVTWPGAITIWRIVIYNRVDDHGRHSLIIASFFLIYQTSVFKKKIRRYTLAKLMIKSLSSVLIGYRLINLNVTYSNNGVTGICGFYPGLLSRDGDIIMFHTHRKLMLLQ